MERSIHSEKSYLMPFCMHNAKGMNASGGSLLNGPRTIHITVSSIVNE
jgi:hypothetical protein